MAGMPENVFEIKDHMGGSKGGFQGWNPLKKERKKKEDLIEK